MRKKISLAFVLMLIGIGMLLAPIHTLAANDTPALTAISFKNASIDGKFDENVQEYTLTLEDNTASPSLAGYGIRGDADIFVNFIYDETNHQKGLTVTLQYEAGSRIYTFTYSNPASYVVNSNNTLSAIYTFYGELMPRLNEDDTVYKLYIPSDLTELTITPITKDINAYCAPIELKLSTEQTPKITLTCTASDGSKRDYTINIKRVDKTTEEVAFEMQQPGFQSFVEGTRLFEKPEFIVAASCTVGGIIVIAILFRITKRIAVNPYDKDEKPFYSTVQ